MCPKGKVPSPTDAAHGMDQANTIRVNDPQATPVNSALNRLQGVVLANHQDPWVRVTTARDAPTKLAKKPIS